MGRINKYSDFNQLSLGGYDIYHRGTSGGGGGSTPPATTVTWTTLADKPSWATANVAGPEWADVLNKVLATTSVDGLLSAADKTKLDSLSAYTAGTGITIASNVISTDTTWLDTYLAGKSYLTVETDPIFVASQAHNITAQHITDLNKLPYGLLLSGTTLDLIDKNNSVLGTVTLPAGTTYTAGSGINITGNAISATFDGNYNSLTNLPTIPAAFTLEIASSTKLGGVKPADKGSDTTYNLPITVDTDGKLWGKAAASASPGTLTLTLGTEVVSYNGSTDKSLTIPEQAYADWTATTGLGQILHKPTLADVATSGDYIDLINKPIAKKLTLNINGNTTEYDTTVDKTVTLNADKNIIEVVKVDGTALTVDANKAVNVVIPKYNIISKGAGSAVANVYQLLKDGVDVGVPINIPKDMVVNSGALETVQTADDPYTGALVGDKYIDLTILNSNNDHIYIPIKDLVDPYTEGDGITISNSNVVSAKIDTTNANGLGLSSDGIKLDLATTTTPGALSATDKAKIDAIPNATTVSSTDNSVKVTHSGDDYDLSVNGTIIVYGYYNTADSLLYEDVSFTKPITGKEDVLYISKNGDHKVESGTFQFLNNKFVRNDNEESLIFNKADKTLLHYFVYDNETARDATLSEHVVGDICTVVHGVEFKDNDSLTAGEKIDASRINKLTTLPHNDIAKASSTETVQFLTGSANYKDVSTFKFTYDANGNIEKITFGENNIPLYTVTTSGVLWASDLILNAAQKAIVTITLTSSDDAKYGVALLQDDLDLLDAQFKDWISLGESSVTNKIYLLDDNNRWVELKHKSVESSDSSVTVTETDDSYDLSIAAPDINHPYRVYNSVAERDADTEALTVNYMCTVSEELYTNETIEATSATAEDWFTLFEEYYYNLTPFLEFDDDAKNELSLLLSTKLGITQDQAKEKLNNCKFCDFPVSVTTTIDTWRHVASDMSTDIVTYPRAGIVYAKNDYAVAYQLDPSSEPIIIYDRDPVTNVDTLVNLQVGDRLLSLIYWSSIICKSLPGASYKIKAHLARIGELKTYLYNGYEWKQVGPYKLPVAKPDFIGGVKAIHGDTTVYTEKVSVDYEGNLFVKPLVKIKSSDNSVTITNKNSEYDLSVAIPTSDHPYKIYDTLADRDADTAFMVDGNLCTVNGKAEKNYSAFTSYDFSNYINFKVFNLPNDFEKDELANNCLPQQEVEAIKDCTITKVELGKVLNYNLPDVWHNVFVGLQNGTSYPSLTGVTLLGNLLSFYGLIFYDDTTQTVTDSYLALQATMNIPYGGIDSSGFYRDRLEVILHEDGSAQITYRYNASLTPAAWVPFGENYVLPVASSTILGGVKAINANSTLTEPVGIKSDGTLVTNPITQAYKIYDSIDDRDADSAAKVDNYMCTVSALPIKPANSRIYDAIAATYIPGLTMSYLKTSYFGYYNDIINNLSINPVPSNIDDATILGTSAPYYNYDNSDHSPWFLLKTAIVGGNGPLPRGTYVSATNMLTYYGTEIFDYNNDVVVTANRSLLDSFFRDEVDTLTQYFHYDPISVDLQIPAEEQKTYRYNASTASWELFDNDYTLPIATNSILGGVTAATKTSLHSELVAVDSYGKLYVKSLVNLVNALSTTDKATVISALGIPTIKTLSVTILPTDWNSLSYSCTADISSATTIILSCPAPNSMTEAMAANVLLTGEDAVNKTITFSCGSVPTLNVTMNVMLVG